MIAISITFSSAHGNTQELATYTQYRQGDPVKLHLLDSAPHAEKEGSLWQLQLEAGGWVPGMRSSGEAPLPDWCPSKIVPVNSSVLQRRKPAWLMKGAIFSS
ncbi:MAG: hypothetical protein Hals2KO_32590 [Halioglobus sp.]